ncbi:TPA: AAA family ATPase [Campylobacter coli]|uniref:AAA family ATPase n=1 Tax=Campylobacter coli TaxID=195 RepID=UPI00092F3D37|nr:AAA family ATPase [Campylobacter coli]ECK7763443.1 AAA family ATPase [Campylobacter coli]ECK7764302.1 AAA family ATPase [Campylobacter coli]HED6131048.1 AAA family ATPase [Campylobacter coli]HEF3940306.1 AAA family ATPase [Campylobacter coli]HEF3940487.1 AAA family ATPase [Campylobacter coli]
MKILKFDKINFGSYENFTWDNGLEEFKTINIFYGRNYSGKTTLSRIARSFELKKHNEDFLDGNFKIKLEDGSFLTQNDVINSNLDIRVYNSDFVKENLNYLYDKKGNIKGFKSIGVEQKDIKESIEKRKEILKTRNEKLKDIQANRENISKTQQAKIKTLNEKLIDKAKLVKSEPNLIKQGSNYDKRNLENDLIEIKDNINAYILNNEEQNQLIKILEDKEKQNIIFKNTFNKDNFQGIFTYSLKILEKEVIIKENLTSELRKWLEEGLEFHKEHSFTQQCKFCNNPLTLERIAWIENNIKDDSGEKEQIEKELKDLLDNFESYKLESKKLLLGIEYENFYSNYKDIFIGLKEQLGVSIANYNEELLKIEKKLTKKKKDVFTPMKLENINDFSDEILQILNKIENLCKENNEYAKNLLSKQDEARKKLRLNEVAKFAKDSDCFAKQDEIKNLGQKLSNMQSTIETEKNEINNYNLEIEKYKEKLSNLETSTSNINKYLKSYFGHNMLELKAKKDDKGQLNREFEILRNGKQAKNLSEGECSLVAFCYFVASLEDAKTKDKNPIIWIDDPISSLDNNHIFFIFSLIEAKIAKKIKDNKYSQLFISTHNLDFLKYIKRFKKSKPKQNENDKTDYEFPQYYFIEKSIKENTETSEIKKLPKCLEKYTTEFNYLFEQIYKFKNIDDTYNEDLKISLVYNFGNNLRKFLEIYLFFKYPNNFESLDKELIERFFNDTYQSDNTDENHQRMIANITNRYQNEYSHLREILSRGMQPIDIEESKKIADFILKMIEKNDNNQFKALVRSISNDR